MQLTKDDATSKVVELAVVRLVRNTLWEIYTNLLGFALTNILWETCHGVLPGDKAAGGGVGRRWNFCANMLVHHFYNSPCCSIVNYIHLLTRLL